MRSRKSTCFSIVPFVPGSFMPKNPKLLSLRCLQHHRRVFQQETKVQLQVQVEVEARQEITKRIFPGNPLIDLDPQHVVGGRPRGAGGNLPVQRIREDSLDSEGDRLQRHFRE